MSLIVHIVSGEDWAETQTHPKYAPPSLDSSGFIHFADPDQVVSLANFLDLDMARNWKLVCVETGRLDPAVEYEGEPPYPHVYGPIDESAIVEVVSFPTDEEEMFRLPERLEKLD